MPARGDERTKRWAQDAGRLLQEAGVEGLSEERGNKENGGEER